MSNSKKRNPQAMPSAHDDNQRTNACVSVSAPAAPVMVHGFIEGCHQHGGRHAAAPRRLLGAALTLKPCAPWMRKKYSGLEERPSQRNLHQQSHLCPSGHFLNDRVQGRQTHQEQASFAISSSRFLQAERSSSATASATSHNAFLIGISRRFRR